MRKASRFQETAGVIMVVEVWEEFLLHDRHNIFERLSAYSLDNGPVGDSADDLSTVTFRFTSFDWNTTLRTMLEQHNIPVVRVVPLVGDYTGKSRP